MSPSKQPRATATEVEREASRYLVQKLGDRLWAGEPTYDEDREQWTVPIHARSLPAHVVLGAILLDAHGVVIHAPSRLALQRAIQRHQSETPSSLSLLPFVFAPARTTGAEARAPLVLPDLPEDPGTLGQEILNDADLRTAYQYLKLALADPQIRPTVLAALEAFARAARSGP